jgi:hypothetical protein
MTGIRRRGGLECYTRHGQENVGVGLDTRELDGLCRLAAWG